MRPIDADTLIKDLYCDVPIAVFGSSKRIGRIINYIEKRKTLDAVPVIRCTECKYFGPGAHQGFWFCENWGVDISEEKSPPEAFYCADGEPKEET